jgi:hypothetical protein
MKRLYITVYEYRDDLDKDDLRELTRTFPEVGTTSGVIAHHTKLDGMGGFLVQEVADDPEQDFEITIRYTPWMRFQVLPVTTIEDAFPVIQRVYG